MGCDGGTIPRRDELVRTKKKPEQKDKNAETVAKWKHCAISQNPLHKPIVSCELGKMYNKESVLEHLLNKGSSTAEVAEHIKKLSDVKELNLTEKTGFKVKTSHKGDEYVDFHDSRYMCPVTGLEMNGKQRFYFMWKCGCVLSERAIKQVKSETCHKCGKSYAENDVIILNGTDVEIEALQKKMNERRRLSKLNKKKKKCESSVGSEAKKIKIEPVDSSDSSLSNDHSNLSNGVGKGDKQNKNSDAKFEIEPTVSSSSSVDHVAKKIKIEPADTSDNSLANYSILSNGIDKEGKMLNKYSDVKVKIEPGVSSAVTSNVSVPPTKEVNGKKASAIKNGNGKVPFKNVKLPEKAKHGYSIADDPSASEAYKSLFTSHTSAKKQGKAHWITHNPLYF